MSKPVLTPLEKRRAAFARLQASLAVPQDYIQALESLLASKKSEQLGFGANFATVTAVQNATGEKFDWLPMRRWCKGHGQHRMMCRTSATARSRHGLLTHGQIAILWCWWICLGR